MTNASKVFVQLYALTTKKCLWNEN